VLVIRDFRLNGKSMQQIPDLEVLREYNDYEVPKL
jgi:hypothetical protein